MARRAGLLLFVLVALAAAGPAHAVPGALRQLEGPAGCVANALTGCTPARGLDKVSGLALSPDGRFLYAVSAYTGSEHALTAFARDPIDGRLTQLDGPGGCVSQVAVRGCGRGHGLRGAIDVTVSGDGRNVYVAAPYNRSPSDTDGAVAIFTRDPDTGAVAQLPGRAGCVSEAGRDGCARGRALDGVAGVTVSPDGRRVYAVAGDSGAVVTFAREPATGSLRQLAGRAGCVREGGGFGCARGRGLESAVGLVASPDGRNVYVAASLQSHTVSVFATDAATGQLRQLGGRHGCVSTRGAHGCAAARGGLRAAVNVAISADGTSVYVAAFQSETITQLRRDPATGRLRPEPPVRAGVATGLAVAPDGRSVYVTDTDGNAVRPFARDAATGQLRPLPDGEGCVASIHPACVAARGLAYAFAVVVSPDGRNVYVAGEYDDAIAVFARAAAQ
ncbi:lactonase family protein [Solirubrobacter taibaiensis]|nr:lactonase family protein [Solirubrobacter taibaiensis]